MELLNTDSTAIQNRLTNKLNEAMVNLRKNDYEDNDSQTYYLLNEFVEEVKNGTKLESPQYTKLIRSVEAFETILCST